MGSYNKNPVNKLLDNNDSFTVTGVMMQYIEICPREVWFEYNNIEINRDNKHIIKGSIVDENSYEFLNKNKIRIGPIAPDMLDNGKIVEIKPSKSFEKSKMNLLTV